MRSSGCFDIFADDSISIPDLQGKVLAIKAKSIQMKADAFLTILRKLEETEILIFIPEALVSIVIGAKGRTIN